MNQDIDTLQSADQVDPGNPIIPMGPTPSKNIKVNGIDLAVVELGQGGIPLIFVHGFSGAKEDFTPWIQILAQKGFHVVMYDQRGHGQSGKPESPDAYSLETMSSDLLGLIKAVGFSSCIALGHSLGGMILEEALLKEPSIFKAVILMDTHYGPISIPKEVLPLIKEILDSQGTEGLLKASKAIGMMSATKEYLEIVENKPEYAKFTDRKFLETSPDAFEPLAATLSNRVDRLSELGNVDTDCLVICGQNDTGFLPACEELAKTMKNAQLALIENAGHLPQFENPGQWWDALYGFISKLQ